MTIFCRWRSFSSLRRASCVFALLRSRFLSSIMPLNFNGIYQSSNLELSRDPYLSGHHCPATRIWLRSVFLNSFLGGPSTRAPRKLLGNPIKFGWVDNHDRNYAQYRPSNCYNLLEKTVTIREKVTIRGNVTIKESYFDIKIVKKA